ncbi:MAG TPA: UDP-N-acetylmuramoyl-tripeptide--D-alanyl-D-alanine ligase [Flavitalea sp.]|nr:UDP-N-acetylmuramoyl-tripeptide--D-alanyl-D-alanine ligase [Flavitalea sp.]
MNIEDLYLLFQQNPSVETDTRKLKKGDIFFALKGPNYNGNDFAGQAIESGAAYVIADEKQAAIHDNVIVVEDVLTSLQALAAFHRRQFNIPVIAITGSNGKTTTKELVHAVLSSTYKTYTTKGNLNNQIGIPLTILRIGSDAEYAVIEMGANHQGEIASYCKYTQPTHGLITNCGKAHLEGFGSVEGVRKGKGELFDYLRENKKSAFVNADDEILMKMSEGIPNVVTYGTKNGQVTGHILKSKPYLHVELGSKMESLLIETKLVGNYNLPNVLAAVTIGNSFAVALEKIRMGIGMYEPSNSRSQLIEKGKNKIILDAYNANPSSMKVAIENFTAIESMNKLLVLGSMAELGESSIEEHESLVELIKKFHWKDVILVGSEFEKIPHPFVQFQVAEDAASYLRSKDYTDTYLLVKGSRSMQMEKILEGL